MSNSDGMDAEREAFEQLTRRDSQDPASANDFSLFCAGYAAALRTTATAAQAEPVAVATFPPRIMEVLLEIADRKGTPTRGPWEDGDGLPLQDAADEAIAWISRATPQPPTAEPGQPSSAVGVEGAFQYASNLAMALFNKHYADDPDYVSGRSKFGLCDTTAGILTQIDNMVSGLVRQPPEQGRAADVAVSDAQINRALNTYMEGSHATGNAAMRAALEQFVSLQPPASPVAVPTLRMKEMRRDDGRIGWYIDGPDFYCDVEPDDSGQYTVFFRDRQGREGYAEQATQTPLQPLADSRGSDEVGV